MDVMTPRHPIFHHQKSNKTSNKSAANFLKVEAEKVEL